MKKNILISIIIFVAILFTGCTSHRGSVKAPILPSYTECQSESNIATVVLYRSDDMAGTLKFNDERIFADYNFQNTDNYDVSNIIMTTNRNQYMVRTFKPGIHTFSFVNMTNSSLSTQVVKLDAGKVYYLALTYKALIGFMLNGIPGLEFRTVADFIRLTAEDKEIYLSGKCILGTSCEYKEVETINPCVGNTSSKLAL